MKTYHIGQTVVPYQIEWSPDRSTISISMDNSMELTVRAPVDVTHADVEAVLDSRRQWILETLYGLSEQQDPPLDKEFLTGEKLLFRGRRYPLTVRRTNVPEPRLYFDENEFNLTVPESSKTSSAVKRQVVTDWYFRRARRELPKRVDKYTDKFGVVDVDIDVRDLSQKWGQFEPGRVSLHWRLVLAPVRIQDYVVVHELAHARHDTHSDAFWNTVGTVVPDYEDRREWLRINGSSLTV